MHEYNNDIWLCRSPEGGCSSNNAFGPAVDTLLEVGAFLKSTPSAIITIFIKDHVSSKDGLTNLFLQAGLDHYRFPLSKMPKGWDGDWPRVDEMIQQNHRLLIFTTDASKKKAGFAYKWRFVLENKYGDLGMQGSCENREESDTLTEQSPSLFLLNFWLDLPFADRYCNDNSGPLASMVELCKNRTNRFPNYIAVDYYMRSSGGGVFKLLDCINGETLCGCNSINACQLGNPGHCNSEVTPIPKDPPSADNDTGITNPSGTAAIHCSQLFSIRMAVHVTIVAVIFMVVHIDK